jgi:hypothetical protein
MSISLMYQILLLMVLPVSVIQLRHGGVDSTRIKAVNINRNITITGRLSDPLWSKAQKVELTNKVKPNDTGKALQKTYAEVLCNKSSLYIGFICLDTQPSRIRAHITDRDKITSDDYVGIMIDPYDNNQTAFGFFVNPDGIQMDLRGNGVPSNRGGGGPRRPGGGPGGGNNGHYEDPNYNALWYSKAAVNDTGYTAVIEIPFKSLSFPNKKIQNWSIQFVRNYPRNNDYEFTWSHINLNESCQLCQNGYLTDIRNISNKNTIEFLPYILGNQTSALNNTDDPSSGTNNSPVDLRVGGSVSYSPTSSLSLNAVFNPDFSQVATDATQISVNNNFAINYPEKRPFFLKGQSLFHTNMRLFYSRVITDPLMAGKATEKSGNFSLAYLTAYDRNIGFIIPGLQQNDIVNSNLQSYDNIFRPRYNFGSSSHIGGLLTTRNVGNSHNYITSLDWNVEVMNHYYFNGQYAYSNTKELNDTSLTSGIGNRHFGNTQYDAAFNGQSYNGNGLQLQFQRRAKYYTFSVNYHGFSPTFQAQNGFITHINQRQFRAQQQISYYPSNAFLDHGNVGMQGRVQYDYSGLVMMKNFGIMVMNQFTHQTNLFFGYDIVKDQRYNDTMFKNLHQLHIGMHSDLTNYFSFGGHMTLGRFIYYEDATLGKGYNFSGGIRFKPTPRLNLHLTFNYSKLSSVKADTEFYSGDITRLVGNYNFTKRLFIRMISQYDSFNNEIQLYPLIYYKVNPFTVFYAGMTDYMDKFDPPYDYKRTTREFFVKFQYLIRR